MRYLAIWTLPLLLQNVACLEDLDEELTCLPKFPIYRIHEGYDAKIMGCYHCRTANHIFPGSSLINLWNVENFEEWARRGDAKDMIQRCGMNAITRGESYFGVRSFSQCYTGNKPDLRFDDLVTESDTCSRYCKFDLGGQDAMVVYKILTIPVGKECQATNLGYNIISSYWALNRGCYQHKDNQKTVLPMESMRRVANLDNEPTSPQNRTADMLILRCGAVAREEGKAFFGLSNYRECYFGKRANFSVQHIMEKDDCLEMCGGDVGGPGAIVVYQIKERFTMT